MKKMYLIAVLLAFTGFLAFADNAEQEEIDYLLFLPNSSNGFVSQNQAMVQLDNLAKFLITKNPGPGQIYVYGYAATATNDIDAASLSKERAVFVMNELQKRGVPNELFAEPVGYGSVDTWGGNTNEANRIPNRRVRIVLEGNVLNPQTVAAADTEIAKNETPVQENPTVIASQGQVNKAAAPHKARFPWKIVLAVLVLALIIIAILLAARPKKDAAAGKAVEKTPPQAADIPVAASVAAISVSTVNLEDEIRFCAYMMSLQRNGQYGDPQGDWYAAVIEICTKYEAEGFRTYPENDSWWAKKETVSRA